MVCFNSYNHVSFRTIGKTNSKLDLKIKETLYIIKKKLNLNAQQNLIYYNFASPLCLSFCFAIFDDF